MSAHLRICTMYLRQLMQFTCHLKWSNIRGTDQGIGHWRKHHTTTPYYSNFTPVRIRITKPKSTSSKALVLSSHLRQDLLASISLSACGVRLRSYRWEMWRSTYSATLDFNAQDKLSKKRKKEKTHGKEKQQDLQIPIPSGIDHHAHHKISEATNDNNPVKPRDLRNTVL